MELSELKDRMNKLGHVIFEDDSKNFNLNIVGVRSRDMTPNTFNDELHVFWKFRGKWSNVCFAITTDPGLYYLKNPINVDGTIIMKPGQYFGAYKNGLHKGERALEQKKPMHYWRDFNRDKVLDTGGKTFKSNAKTNIHGAGKNSTLVDKWSAGCQVVANEDDFNLLLYLTHKAEKYWGNSFTYTLIEE